MFFKALVWSDACLHLYLVWTEVTPNVFFLASCSWGMFYINQLL